MTAFLSAARGAWSRTRSGTNKIRVYPVSLGPDRSPIVVWSSFYALGCLVAYAKVHRDGALHERFDFGRITPMPGSQIPNLLSAVRKEPAVFLLSCYVWNFEVNVEFARSLKQCVPGAVVIVGGPHVPRMPGPCDEFFAQHPYFDIAVRQEGEITLAEILSEMARSGAPGSDLLRVDLSTVEGLTFRRNGDLVRTPDRAKTADLSVFPSPYTTGEFDHWIKGTAYLPIETNRGCPYGCTFCDWGAATLSKVARMSMERVLGEVEFSAKNRIDLVGICDANFGILPRDADIAGYLVEMKNTYGYPRELGYTNAKTASPRLTEIIKILHDGGLIAGGQISMQTTDEEILKNVKRDNIKISEYRKMITFFNKEDIPTASDMMLGLPGQTLETCKRDLQFCFDHKVTAVIFATSVMVNAPMADEEYRRKFQIAVDDEGFVESTYSFTREEYARMFDLCLAYKLFVKLGLLKYFMYFVQIEHGVPAMDFVERWVTQVQARPDRYPISTRIWSELVRPERGGGLKDWLVIMWTDEQAQFLFDSMEAFYAEIIVFYEREHGVQLKGSDAESVVIANREVMPRKDRVLPARVALTHDVAGYFAALRALPSVDAVPSGHIPLRTRGPGYVDLPTQPSTTNVYGDMASVIGKLELASNMRI